MDVGTIINVVIMLGVVFLITSQAKNQEGKKYGIRTMARMWIVAIGFLGFYGLLNPKIEVEGKGSGQIPIVLIILVFMPVAMIGSNIVQWRKRKRAEQVDERTPTMDPDDPQFKKKLVAAVRAIRRAGLFIFIVSSLSVAFAIYSAFDLSVSFHINGVESHDIGKRFRAVSFLILLPIFTGFSRLVHALYLNGWSALCSPRWRI